MAGTPGCTAAGARASRRQEGNRRSVTEVGPAAGDGILARRKEDRLYDRRIDEVGEAGGQGAQAGDAAALRWRLFVAAVMLGVLVVGPALVHVTLAAMVMIGVRGRDGVVILGEAVDGAGGIAGCILKAVVKPLSIPVPILRPCTEDYKVKSAPTKGHPRQGIQDTCPLDRPLDRSRWTARQRRATAR